jgi:hypothetical protein
MDKIVKISGCIGMKVLHNSTLNKKIFIFYDDHSNTKYCEKKSSVFISELFQTISNQDVALILEEPFMESNSKIKILWKESEHLLLFRKFYSKLINKCSKKKICKIFPFDIRLSIFDISPDEIIFNLDNPEPGYNIKLNTYFQNIFYLFDLNDYQPNPSSLICFIKKVFNIYKTSKMYKNLKKRIIDFNNKYNIETSKETIYDLINKYNSSSNFIYEEGFPYINNHNENFIDQLDKIASGIIELYSLILILLLPNKNMILYAGYYHSNNLAYIFEKYYSFKEEFSSGIIDNIDDKTQSQIKSCIKINADEMKFL